MENWQIILIIVALYCALVIAVGVFTRTKGESTLQRARIRSRTILWATAR